MAAGNLVDRCDDAVGQLLGGLAVTPLPVLRLREAAPHLVVGQPLPGAEVLLPEAGETDDREPATREGELGRLPCACQVAGVGGRKRQPFERTTERNRLPAAVGVQRHVGVPLDPAVAIPVGLAVAHDVQQGRHSSDATERRPILARSMDLGLAGKVALVTGSSRGLGLAIARSLAQEGAHVMLTARGAETLDAAVARLDAVGSVSGHVGDVAADNGPAEAVAATVERFGGLDIVVNNVGGSGARTIADTDETELRRMIDVNVLSGYAVARAALPELRRRAGGVIGFVTSIWGREGGGTVGYNVAKGAEVNLANAMARELAPDRIRVFSVAPGCIRHPGGSWDRRVEADPEGMAAFVEREIPWNRFGTAEEVGDVVAFLCSPRASWVVGACLPIDGGQSRSL